MTVNRKLAMEITCITPSYDEPPPVSQAGPPVRPMDEELFPVDSVKLRLLDSNSTVSAFSEEDQDRLWRSLTEWSTPKVAALGAGCDSLWAMGQIGAWYRRGTLERKPSPMHGMKGRPQWVYRRKCSES